MSPSNYTIHEADNSYINLGDNDVLENTIIDFSNGNWSGINANGDGWEIRNVGFRGVHEHDQVAISAQCNGGEGIIHNVYLGDGCIRPEVYASHGQVGIFVHRNHAGHIEISNVNVQNWPNNGIYASAPGQSGAGGGSVRIRDSYGCNNYVSTFRIGSEGSSVENCVAYNDNSGRYTGRPFWGWYPGPYDIIDCDFQSGPYPDAIHIDRGGGTAYMEGTQYDSIRVGSGDTLNRGGGNGNNPDLSAPAQIPTTAEQAASGTSSGGGSGGSPDTGLEDFDVIEVGTGETFSKSVGATETWENKLIDITADGASYDIYAAKGSWTIRNIGIRGKIDPEGAPSAGPFTTDGAAAGETCLLENIYLPGATYGRNEIGTNNPYGLYVSTGHEGTLEIRNYHAFDMPSHGMYCSDPGHPDGGNGGVVEVYDSYVHDLENSGFRLGTTGSFIQNCCAARTTRGLWAYFEDIEAYDSDLVDNDNDIQVGSGAYSKSATATVNNTRFETVNELNGSLSGSSVGTPEDRVPGGCPTSAEEAAGGGSGSPDVDPGERETRHVVENCHVNHTGGENPVGVLIRNGTVKVRDSQIEGPNARVTEEGGEIDATNSEFGESAEASPPDGVPMSALEASGELDNSSDPP